jgi:alpha-N-acetylglucosamine transferase
MGTFCTALAFKSAMYEKQTYSSSKRSLWRQMDKLFCTDSVYEQIYSKHFKKYYKGKPQRGTKDFGRN